MAALSRRGLIAAIICAPAIVRASSLMPVKAVPGALRWYVRDTFHGSTSLNITHIPLFEHYEYLDGPAMTDWLNRAEELMFGWMDNPGARAVNLTA